MPPFSGGYYPVGPTGGYQQTRQAGGVRRSGGVGGVRYPQEEETGIGAEAFESPWWGIAGAPQQTLDTTPAVAGAFTREALDNPLDLSVPVGQGPGWQISSVRPINQLQAILSGTNTVARTPNPNSAMATAARRAQSGYQFGGEALGAGIGQMQRGMENIRAEESLARKKGGLTGAIQGIRSAYVDPRRAGYRQALYEAGVEDINAEGAQTDRQYHGGGITTVRKTPGFFGTQVPQQKHAYDPREARPGGPPNNPYQQYQAGIARRAVDGLQKSQPTPEEKRYFEQYPSEAKEYRKRYAL